MKETILVTGGAGYIGSHTCVELLNSGYNVIIVDNFVNSKPEALKRIKQITNKDFLFIEQDLIDFKGTRKIFEKNKVDAVIHFAGLKAVGESVDKPIEYYHNNLTGTLSLIDAMRKTGCKKIVFSSSATVYGNNNPPFIETMPISSATNPYGQTKVIIERILEDVFAADNDWSISLLRYFNPIGAHKSGLIGEDPNGIPNNLLPFIAKVATGDLPEVLVYGTDYDTPDGTGIRDYIHVCDLATGHIAAVEYILKNKGVEIVNLGTGNGYSVFDVIHSYEKAIGRKLPVKIEGRRAGDIATCYADASKAKKLFGWEAKHSLDEMTADGWNFASKNPKGL